MVRSTFTGPSNPTEPSVSFDYVVEGYDGDTHQATATFDWPVAPTIDLDPQETIVPVPGQGGFTLLNFSDEGESGFDGQSEAQNGGDGEFLRYNNCLLYTSPSPRDATLSRMPSSA